MKLKSHDAKGKSTSITKIYINPSISAYNHIRGDFLIFSGPFLPRDWLGEVWRQTSCQISLEINGHTAYLNVVVQMNEAIYK